MATVQQDVFAPTVSIPATPPVAPTRNSALDFTKGALVLIMVLYHWLNYFVESEFDFFRYLRFLTPSFIFITGFLISNVYFAKYGVTNPRLAGRLVERGLKILGVFVALNLLRAAMLPRASGHRLLAEHSSLQGLINTYVLGANLGGGQGKTIAFFVLVPIGYLLILCALLLPGVRLWRYFFHLTVAVGLISIGLLDLAGRSSANLQLLVIGLLGVVLGYVPMDKIGRVVHHPLLWLASYAGYVAAITIWNVIYPLQIVGVVLSVMLIYLAGDRTGEPGIVRGEIVLLGQYSLVGYIAQIAVLQLLHQSLMRLPLDSNLLLVLSFVLAVGLTVLLVESTARARRQWPAVNSAYRAVFG